MILVDDDDDSELVTGGKFLKMGTLGPTLLIKSKSADTRRWCTHSQVETTNSSQQTYGRVYYRYSEESEFKDGLLHCIDAVLQFTFSIKFRLEQKKQSYNYRAANDTLTPLEWGPII